jgi:hypothetical protein
MGCKAVASPWYACHAFFLLIHEELIVPPATLDGPHEEASVLSPFLDRLASSFFLAMRLRFQHWISFCQLKGVSCDELVLGAFGARCLAASSYLTVSRCTLLLFTHKVLTIAIVVFQLLLPISLGVVAAHTTRFPGPRLQHVLWVFPTWQFHRRRRGSQRSCLKLPGVTLDKGHHSYHV